MIVAAAVQVSVALALAAPAPALAQDEAAPASWATALAPVVTQHTLALPDRRLAYRALAETLPITSDQGETTAQVAVIADLAEGHPAATRPVTFVFNGGPGASSAYLHLGALGPRVLATNPDGSLPAPPAHLRANPDSWLAFTDLVFIDPVGTGFSRAAKPGDEAERRFWSVSGDVASLAEVIRLWLTRNARWASPKFLAGESYGGFRAARLARALLADPGVGLNGLVLISPALEFSTLAPGEHAVLPWALALPSLVAAARAHGRGDPTLSLAEVERFALSEYLTGIAAIAPAGPGPEPALIARLAGLLGLDEAVVRRHHGRVPAQVFAERLLDGTGRALSLYDGARAGPDPQPSRGGGPDPQLEGTRAPFATAYNAYVRNELQLATDLPFRLLNERTARDWDWEGERGGPGGTGGALDELAEALALTPGLGILVVHGRTDLVTPYLASRWLLDRLDLPEEVRGRVRLEVLGGGHMMYLQPDERRALTELAAEFYRRRVPAT